jgi:hypothetical protein
MSSRIGKEPLGGPDARLLRALSAQYPTGRFDECSIAIDAPRLPELLHALEFLNAARVNRRRRSLDYRSHNLLARWFDKVEDRPAGGFLLTRGRRGWCYVSPVAVGPTGAAR